LLINYEYPPVGAGAATATQAIARSVVALGHSATVLTSAFHDLAGTREEEGIRVIRVPSARRRCEAASIFEMAQFMFRATHVVRRIARSERSDGMIAFFSIPSGPAALWANLDRGVPYVVSLRGGDVPGTETRLAWIHRCLAPLRRKILRTARAVVANSPGLKQFAERADPVPVLMVPNGVDTEFFTPLLSSRPSGLPPRLLFVGRFQAQKNLFWLLHQLASIRRETSLKFTLDLVGDGPQRPALVASVSDLQLGDVVRLHRWEDRASLKGRYQAADLLINPSTYEGMPNVVLEAMACGRPVLASRVPGNDAVVVDGVTGRLYSPNDAVDFAACLAGLISQPDLRDRMGAVGRSLSISDHSWFSTTQSYLELLDETAPISKTA
jgi:glycosyltransferase involved in cell wall biosynthesis